MRNQFSHDLRSRNLERLRREEFDLLIIGGGITGAGTARDAASRGMKVALIEGRDFASGTSSRSSKLIHGGIRYLENLEFKLVFEALSERTKLFEMCPHLVHQLRFMIPLYEDSRVGMFKMGLGMWLYDALSLFQAPELHERLNGRDTLERMTSLRPDHLVGSYIYSDGYMDDDRLVHETLRSASEMGAVIVNEVLATGAVTGASGRIEKTVVKDGRSGKEWRISARHVISSVGPWTDELGEDLFKDWKRILRPTKGIHLTLRKDRLPLSSAVVMGAEKSNRIVFGIPRHDMIIIGTTDTDYEGHPEDVIATREDVDYLLDVTARYFPGARIREEDIIASYAGVRPLVNDGSRTEGKTSREHTIFNDPRGVTFVAGGKYTTYRLMAHQVVEKALENFSFEERIQFRATDTAVPLNPWTSPEAYATGLHSADRWARETDRPEKDVRILFERYGREAELILQEAAKDATLWEIEAMQALRNTMCLDLVNFYARRVPLYLATPDHGLHVLESVSSVFQRELGWSDSETTAQKQALRSFIDKELAWKKAPPQA
ncbi:MAG TPA: glycerol-3-phosphate dehydrogenase/oxidase [Pseudobdellovibrionaceae bacterium]|nr:glycerol-3-phosphate dehydrogenase/oxidase [Pseudobdellovibrionaceae bacterium]